MTPLTLFQLLFLIAMTVVITLLSNQLYLDLKNERQKTLEKKINEIINKRFSLQADIPLQNKEKKGRYKK